jgi:hypothetical protein
MKPYRRALVALLLLITLIASVSLTASNTEPREVVNVSIESLPQYGEIYLNGKFVGSTDINRRMSPGVHTIEVRRTGYETWCRELTVTAGNNTRVVALLERPAK